ncbi:hypothetical protein D9C73_004953 [Collichthys lucidus]|uniref:CARD domain-containing protein n=1 Tax=Collichthys lucidus TaxID=240159 RepID=A0A4U5UE94_COLLU|nr:hypothetical protein D9C73_004953 [Collichthys lucidus]
MDKSKSVFTSGNSVVTNREITNVNAQSLNMAVRTEVHQGPSENVGQVPRAYLTACGGSVICADKISGVNIAGDVNLSVTTTLVPAANDPFDTNLHPFRLDKQKTCCLFQGPAAKMITEHKVKLIECLMADRFFILQHVHAKEIVTDREYQDLKHTPQPGQTVTDLIDCVIFKGEDSCSRFIEVLKEPEVVDTYPQLGQITK